LETESLTRIQEQKRRIESKMNDISKLKEELNLLKLENEQYKVDLEKLQPEVHDLCRKLDSLNALNTKLIHSQSESSKFLSSVEKKIVEECELKVLQKKSELASLKEQLNDLSFYVRTQKSISKNPDISQGQLFMFESPEKEKVRHSSSRRSYKKS
jgi:chromosome segregation ATPase